MDKLTEKQRWIVDRVVMSFGMFLEIDDGYRYRFQDVFALINKKSFYKNPALEIERIYGILQSRDLGDGRINPGEGKLIPKYGMKMRFRELIWAVKWAFILFPKAKKKAIEFVKEVDLDKIKMDKGDMYHCAVKSDYNYGGLPYEQRLKERIQEDQEWFKLETNGTRA